MRGLVNTVSGYIVSRYIVSVLLLTAFGSAAHAFELLSEGAMGSVSAVSANSAQEIVNIAGSSAAGLKDDGYEPLPFETGVSLQGYSENTAAPEVEYSLTQEVEAWANNLREQNGVSNFEVGLVEQLQPSLFEDPGFVIRDDGIQLINQTPGTEEGVDVVYQQGRIDDVVRSFQQGIDSVTYEIVRYVERAATIDARPFGEDSPSIGSGYVSDLSASSTVTLTAIRK